MKVWEALFLAPFGAVVVAANRRVFVESEAARVRQRINHSLDNEPSMPWGKSWHNRPDCKPPEVLG